MLENGPQFPGDTIEQLAQLPPMDKQGVILDRLYHDVDQLLTRHGILIDKERSSYRVKTEEAIAAKLKRRGREKLILDIYGLQLILPQDQIYPALEVITVAYPTPEYFPGGVPSLRDYNDPTIPWNPLKQDDYRAVHKNIVFINGSEVGIAEVQLMTVAQQEVAKRNRAAYDADRRAYEAAIEFFGK